MSSPRDHGFGDSPRVHGAPCITDTVDKACPHCGCKPIYGVKVEVRDPPAALRRPSGPHKVVGNYLGCAACPWASPMLTTTELTTTGATRP